MTDVDKAGAVRMADAHGRLAPGDELGGYTVRALLGKGAMGAVYEAVDGGGTAVALKVLHAHLDRDPVARERLRREVTALQRLRHPAVARVLDAELDGEGAFVVTELVQGRTLEEEIDGGGPLDPVDLYELADQLAAALEAVHLAGVVHRDLKPSNVMVTAHGPVLIDFGIATALSESADDTGATLTQPGFVIGTPGYLAPELLDGGTPSAESDWWSWAALLAFAATGRSPFGVRPTDLVLRRSREGRADLVGLPARTARALAAALQADPALRWGPSQVARALRRDSEEAAFAAMSAADPADASGATQRIGTHPERSASAAGALTGETAVVAAPTQLVGAPTEYVPTGTLPDDAGTAHDGLTRAVPVGSIGPETGAVPAVPPGEIPVGIPVAEARYRAYDGQDEPVGEAEPVPAEPYTAPRIAMRTGTVLAFAAPLVVLGATRPLIAFGALAVLVIVCRIAGLAAQAFWDRRERAGVRRGSDGVVAVLAFPWHVLVGALGSIAQLLVSACVGVLVVVGGYWLFGPGRVILAPRADIEARSVGGMNEEIVFGVLLLVATFVAVLVAWFGPAGMTGRKGARALLHTFAPGWIGAVVVIAACLIGAWLLAGPLLATPLEIHWWPLGGPPSL
jgi:predicted Ser/Thr protein kinase